MQLIPKKLYYKIGEVCGIIGVEAHVLRYWETEFPVLTPPKNKGGQRTYRPRDIDLLLRIRRLLYEDGFTIAGARKQLAMQGAENGGFGTDGAQPAAASTSSRRRTTQPDRGKKTSKTPRPTGTRAGEKEDPESDLKRVRRELENILTLLERG